MPRWPVWGCGALLACSAAASDRPEPPLSDDPEARVVEWERRLAHAEPGADTADGQAQAEAARQAAAAWRAQLGLEQLQRRALAGAQRELEAAARWAPTHPAVAQLRATIHETRQTLAGRSGSLRTRLLQWAGQPYRGEDRSAWLALIDDFEALQPWSSTSAELEHTCAEARRPLAVWLAAEAAAEAAAGRSERAAWAVAKSLALGLEPTAPAAAMAPLGSKPAARPTPAASTPAASLPVTTAPRMDATAVASAPPKTPPRPVKAPAAKTGVAAPAAKTAAAASQPGAAKATSGAPAHALDKACTARRMDAERRQLPGAAWFWQHVLDKRAGDTAAAQAQAQRLAAMAATVPRPVVLPPVAVVRTAPAGAAAVFSQAMLARLAENRWAVPVARGQTAEGELRLVVEQFDIERSSRSESRRKPYVDRTELADNPAHAEAVGRQAMTLSALNGALDQIREVQSTCNDAMRTLQQSREQLAEILRTIAVEDAAWYKTRPSPCRDGKLDCDETRGRQQWSQNLTFYRQAITQGEALVRELEPKQARLQAVVDERQMAYDEAQKALAEVPTRVRREVVQQFDYQVAQRTLQVALRAKLVWRPRSGAPVVHEVKLGDVQSCQVNERVETRGQLLEEAFTDVLPSDGALALAWAPRLLDALAPSLQAVLATAADRFLSRLEQLKDPQLRLDALVRTVQAGDAASAAARQRALVELRDWAGWDVDSETIDADRLAALIGLPAADR